MSAPRKSHLMMLRAASCTRRRGLHAHLRRWRCRLLRPGQWLLRCCWCCLLRPAAPLLDAPCQPAADAMGMHEDSTVQHSTAANRVQWMHAQLEWPCMHRWHAACGEVFRCCASLAARHGTCCATCILQASHPATTAMRYSSSPGQGMWWMLSASADMCGEV